MDEGTPNPVAEAQRDAQQRLDDSIAWALGTEQGRRLLAHLVYGAAKLEANAFTGDAFSRDYNLGQQSVGRWLLQQCDRVDAGLTDKLVMERRRDAREVRNGNVHGPADSLP